MCVTLYSCFVSVIQIRSLCNMTDKENQVLGEDGKPLSKAQLKKLEKQKEKEQRKQQVADRLVKKCELINDIGC
jgi:hypothetical protein